MGLFGPLVGWLAWKALRGVHQRAAAFVAAWVAVQVSTLGVVAALGLQHALSARHFPLPLAVVLPAMMAPSLAVTGVVEGAYTLFALSLLRKADLRGASPV
jgi:cobalt/nickel transport system permease protein